MDNKDLIWRRMPQMKGLITKKSLRIEELMDDARADERVKIQANSESLLELGRFEGGQSTAIAIFAELDKLDIGIGTITGEDGETSKDVRAVYIEDYLALKSKYGVK